MIDLSQWLFETPCSLRTTAEVVSSSILSHCIPKVIIIKNLLYQTYFIMNFKMFIFWQTNHNYQNVKKEVLYRYLVGMIRKKSLHFGSFKCFGDAQFVIMQVSLMHCIFPQKLRMARKTITNQWQCSMGIHWCLQWSLMYFVFHKKKTFWNTVASTTGEIVRLLRGCSLLHLMFWISSYMAQAMSCCCPATVTPEHSFRF